MSSTAKQQLSRNPSNAGYATPIKTYPVPAVTNEDGTISVPAQAVYLIDPTVEPIPMGSDVTLKTVLNTYPLQYLRTAEGLVAAGLTVGLVPTGVTCNAMFLTLDIVCTGTVGNRIVYVRVVDAGTRTIWAGSVAAAGTAGQTIGYDVAFAVPGATPSTTVRRNLGNTANVNVMVRENCPLSVLGPGYSVVIDDTADVDIADAVTSRFTYRAFNL